MKERSFLDTNILVYTDDPSTPVKQTRALELHRLYHFSFWDSLIIRMAQKTSCSILLSEDFQHGQSIGDVRIVNPFRT